jgi:hypothetical protein
MDVKLFYSLDKRNSLEIHTAFMMTGAWRVKEGE